MTRAGLNLIQQAISIYDSDLKLAVSNQRFQEMFDLPAELVTPGATFNDTIRLLLERGEYGEIDDIDSALQLRVDQALDFEPHYMERTRPDGRTISVEGNPLPQGGWVTVYTDITKIKQQEALLRSRSEVLSDQLLDHTERLSKSNRKLAATITQLEEAKRQLTEMEARTRTTTEMMPAHIAHVGVDRRYTFSNRQLPVIMPGRSADILGEPIDVTLGKGAWRHIAPDLDRAFEGHSSVFEFTDDDSSRRIRTAFTPDLRDGVIHGVYILTTDVTKESQARAALAQTHKRELAAQLTSGLAHDFANLLTIILGLQSRLSRMDPAEEAAGLIAATQATARRGGRLLDRIAQMSGHREVKPVATDLSAFLQDIKLLARPTLPDHIRLEVYRCDVGGLLMLDPGFLQDSLLNLLLNAGHAIGERTGRITVTTTTLRETWLEVAVDDSGPGFSEKALTHGMEPFFSTKGEEGSGLGLSMVYDMTRSAGGHVRLANTETGARVTLRLPLRTAKSDAPPGLVLLVEDNDEIRRSVREMLMDMEHTVIEATSAEEGLSLAQVSGIDLVLSDISLVGSSMTGIEMLDRMAETGVNAPGHLMTSLPAHDMARRDGESRYPLIRKPFNSQELAVLLSQSGDSERDKEVI